MDTASCPIVAGAPEVMKAAFTKEIDFFAARGIEYVDPAVDVRRAEPDCAQQHVRDLGPAPRHHRGRERLRLPRRAATALDAVRRARWRTRAARSSRRSRRRTASRSSCSAARTTRDPGLNHGVLEEFQVLGYPILSMRSIPKDPRLARALLRGGPRRGARSRSPLDVHRRVAGELLDQQRAEGLGGEVRRAAPERRGARSLELQVRPRRADLRPHRQHHRLERDALRGAARHRRQQAGRLDQDPRQDVRAHAQAPRGTARGAGGEKERARKAGRSEAARAARASGRDRSARPAQARPEAVRRFAEMEAAYEAYLVEETTPAAFADLEWTAKREPAPSCGMPALPESRSTNLVQIQRVRRNHDDASSRLQGHRGGARAFEARERERLGLGAEPVEAVARSEPADLHPDAARRRRRFSSAASPWRTTSSSRPRCAASATRFETLDCPTTRRCRFGKEFGNRGQCNPTYFTVGNLVKYLDRRCATSRACPTTDDRRELRLPHRRRVRPVPLRHVRHRVPQGAPRRRLRRLPRDAVPAAGRPQAGDGRRASASR